jgi:hypothetical protein
MTGQALPKGFTEDIVPVLRMEEYFALANCQEVIVAANFNANAVGTTTIPEFLVPAGEAWLVLGGSVSFTTAAAEFLRARFIALRGPTTSPNVCPFRLIGEAASGISAGVGQVQMTTTVDPFLLYSGDNLGVNVANITTAGNIAISSRICVFRFTI